MQKMEAIRWMLVFLPAVIGGFVIGRMSQWEHLIHATADIISRMKAATEGKVEDHHAVAEVALVLNMPERRAKWFVSFAMCRFPGIRASIFSTNWGDKDNQ